MSNSLLRPRISAVVVFAPLIVLVCCSAATADFVASISVSLSPAGDGLKLYEYEIVNDPTSTETINAFALDVGPGADLMSIEGPDGWLLDYSADEDPFEFAADSGGPAFDIPIGGTGVFSFTSPLDPDPLFYFVASLNADGSDNGNLFDVIDSPAVPPADIAGDYNGNGIVDAPDYNLWRDTFGSITELAADGNGNGIIDAPDYGVWRDNFGAAAAAVPEPASAGLCIVALCCLACRQRRTS